jgi:hypothetical protein
MEARAAASQVKDRARARPRAIIVLAQHQVTDHATQRRRPAINFLRRHDVGRDGQSSALAQPWHGQHNDAATVLSAREVDQNRTLADRAVAVKACGTSGRDQTEPLSLARRERAAQRTWRGGRMHSCATHAL